jgi:hypothetical protein
MQRCFQLAYISMHAGAPRHAGALAHRELVLCIGWGSKGAASAGIVYSMALTFKVNSIQLACRQPECHSTVVVLPGLGVL